MLDQVNRLHASLVGVYRDHRRSMPGRDKLSAGDCSLAPGSLLFLGCLSSLWSARRRVLPCRAHPGGRAIAPGKPGLNWQPQNFPARIDSHASIARRKSIAGGR